jgi:predicted SnoaL-like aldol condensation-catalyzing enzyme
VRAARSLRAAAGPTAVDAIVSFLMESVMATLDIRNAAIEFLTMCASGNVRDAYGRHVAAGFKHHNPYFRSDRTSLLEAMEQSAADEPNKSFDVKLAIASNDTVAVFSHLQRAQTDVDYAVVHILRFEDGKIVEMWDIGQEVPSDSPNELGMF